MCGQIICQKTKKTFIKYEAMQKKLRLHPPTSQLWMFSGMCCCWHRASWRSTLWQSTGNSMRRWELQTKPILGGRGFTLLWWTSTTIKFEKGSQNRTDKKRLEKLSLQWIQCARAHHYSERWQEGWTSAICSNGRIKLILFCLWNYDVQCSANIDPLIWEKRHLDLWLTKRMLHTMHLFVCPILC